MCNTQPKLINSAVEHYKHQNILTCMQIIAIKALQLNTSTVCTYHICTYITHENPYQCLTYRDIYAVKHMMHIKIKFIHIQ